MAPSIEDLERILAADPRSPVFLELGDALADSGKHPRAAMILRAGLVHHPDLVHARIALARSLFELGDRQAALGEIVLVAARDREDPFAARLANDLLASLGLASEIKIGEGAPAAPSGRAAAALERQAMTPVSRAPGPAAAALERQATTPVSRAPGRAAAALERQAMTPVSRAPGPAAAALERQAMTPVNRAPGPAAPCDAVPGLVRLGDPGADPGQGSFEASGAIELPPEFLQEIADPFCADPAKVRPVAPDRTRAARITAAYQRKLREGAAAHPPSPRRTPGFLASHRLALAAGAVLLVAGATTAAWLAPRPTSTGGEVGAAVEAARSALARDTVGALRDGARLLAKARALDPRSRDAASLEAQVNAVLAAEHGDAAARRTANAVVASGRAGEGALVARWLLAHDDAARARAAESLTAAPPGAGPLVHALAGRAHRARGRTDLAVRHLQLALRASPPSLRALADLGDIARERGDLERAMEFYEAALAAHPAHPRSVLGAAEVRLARRTDLPRSLAELEAVSRDPGSAPPVADRPRLALLRARVLEASGRADEANRAFDEARSAASRPSRRSLVPARAERRRARW